MPRICCIPGCKANYESTLKTEPRVSTFAIPKDEKQRKRWLKVIRREDWSPLKKWAVCSKHFYESEIIYEDVVDRDGCKFIEALHRPRLEFGAVPHIFPDAALHKSRLKMKQPIASKDTDIQTQSMSQHTGDNQIPSTSKYPGQCSSSGPDSVRKPVLNVTKTESGIIHSYSDLVTNLETNVALDDWTVGISGDNLIFYIVNTDTILLNGPIVSASVVIDNSLNVNVFLSGRKLNETNLAWVLPKNCRLERWAQLQIVLSRYKYYEE